MSINIPKNNTNYVSQKYLYYFDYPGIKETGYVEINSNQITIFFPEKEFPDLFTDCNQNIMVFINEELKLAYNLLPIFTMNDYLKIKNMFTICYIELANVNFEIKEFNNPNYYDEIVSKYQFNNLFIDCFESNFTTSIQISFDKTKKLLDKKINLKNKQIQIFIGKKIMFSSDIFQEYIANDDIDYLINFVLYKLIK